MQSLSSYQQYSSQSVNVHQDRVILGKMQFNLVREFSYNILFTVSTDRQAIIEPGLFVSRF